MTPPPTSPEELNCRVNASNLSLYTCRAPTGASASLQMRPWSLAVRASTLRLTLTPALAVPPLPAITALALTMGLALLCRWRWPRRLAGRAAPPAGAW